MKFLYPNIHATLRDLGKEETGFGNKKVVYIRK